MYVKHLKSVDIRDSMLTLVQDRSKNHLNTATLDELVGDYVATMEKSFMGVDNLENVIKVARYITGMLRDTSLG